MKSFQNVWRNGNTDGFRETIKERPIILANWRLTQYGLDFAITLIPHYIYIFIFIYSANAGHEIIWGHGCWWFGFDFDVCQH